MEGFEPLSGFNYDLQCIATWRFPSLLDLVPEEKISIQLSMSVILIFVFNTKEQIFIFLEVGCIEILTLYDIFIEKVCRFSETALVEFLTRDG